MACPPPRRPRSVVSARPILNTGSDSRRAPGRLRIPDGALQGGRVRLAGLEPVCVIRRFRSRARESAIAVLGARSQSTGIPTGFHRPAPGWTRNAGTTRGVGSWIRTTLKGLDPFPGSRHPGSNPDGTREPDAGSSSSESRIPSAPLRSRARESAIAVLGARSQSTADPDGISSPSPGCARSAGSRHLDPTPTGLRRCSRPRLTG